MLMNLFQSLVIKPSKCPLELGELVVGTLFVGDIELDYCCGQVLIEFFVCVYVWGEKLHCKMKSRLNLSIIFSFKRKNNVLSVDS